MFLLNQLKTPDIIFFVACVVVVLLIVGIYFLIPVLNKKQYEEQRQNLRKREASFRANLKTEETKDIEAKTEDDDK